MNIVTESKYTSPLRRQMLNTLRPVGQVHPQGHRHVHADAALAQRAYGAGEEPASRHTT